MNNFNKSLLVFLISILTISIACQKESANEREASNLPPLAKEIVMKFISKGEGKHLPKLHNAISVNMIVKNAADSVLMDFSKQKRPLVLEKDSTWDAADNLFAVFNHLVEGDSVHVSLPAIKAFNGRTPPKVNADDIITMEIKIDNIYENAIAYHKENWNIDMKKIIDENEELIISQEKAINDWLTEKGLTAEKTEHGVYYVVEKKGDEDSSIQPFDKVKIHYTLRNNKGKIIDTSVEEMAKEAGTYQEGIPYQPYPVVIGATQVIKGWHEGIPYFKNHGKGKLLIPSYFAYGDRGYPPNIQPNEFLIFDIEVTDLEPSDIRKK